MSVIMKNAVFWYPIKFPIMNIWEVLFICFHTSRAELFFLYADKKQQEWQEKHTAF